MRELAELLDQRVAVLDGAWGTMLQGKKLSAADYHVDGHQQDTAGDPDLLNLTRPDVILDIHRQYLAAGRRHHHHQHLHRHELRPVRLRP